MSKQTKSLNWATVDFRNPEELALANRLELERLKANRDAAVKRLQKKGILDSHGRLIDRTLPPDMRPGSKTDFGG